MAFVPFSPLGRGVLTANIPDPAVFAAENSTDFRNDNPRFVEPNYARNIAALEPFKAFARELGASPAELAIAWLLYRGDHLIPIPGTRSARFADIELGRN